VAHLSDLGATAEELFSAELIFGELIGNVVRYAPGAMQVVLDTRNESPVLHVLDEGKGFILLPRLPTDMLSERGRGLFLIWTLSDDFNVDLRPDGGAHARSVLPVRLGREHATPKRNHARRVGNRRATGLCDDFVDVDRRQTGIDRGR
jgi:hypothetical protein